MRTVIIPKLRNLHYKEDEKKIFFWRQWVSWGASSQVALSPHGIASLCSCSVRFSGRAIMMTDTHVNGHEQEEWLWPWDDFHFLRSSISSNDSIFMAFLLLPMLVSSILLSLRWSWRQFREDSHACKFYDAIKTIFFILLFSCFLLSEWNMAWDSPKVINNFLIPMRDTTTTNAIPISLSAAKIICSNA